MNKRSLARFVGVIRLVENVDTIGIPVFSMPHVNQMFIPEMDTDFRILRFDDFFNGSGYLVTYDLEKPFRHREYSIGDYAPIPFWMMGKCEAVEGDSDPDMLVWHSNASPIVNEVARILRAAKQGKYEQRRQLWQSADIENRFEDVFFEMPSHSRYWVSRYRVAVASARKEAEPPHPIDRKLRVAGQKWLSMFATKTDINRLLGVLGEPKDGVFSTKWARNILFAYIVHHRLKGDLVKVEQETAEQWFTDSFPGGLYKHFLENGWPRVPFSYKRPRDFLSPMRDAFYEGLRVGSFKKAIALSKFYFGQSDAPKQIEDIVYPQINIARRKVEIQKKSSNLIFRDRGFRHSWGVTAGEIISTYQKIREMDSIINGISRNRDLPPEHYGFELAYLRVLRDYQKQDNE